MRHTHLVVLLLAMTASAQKQRGRRPQRRMLMRPPPKVCAPGTNASVGFVHVNKAGGTAMISMLHKYADFQLLERRHPTSAFKLRSIGSRFFHASASLQVPSSAPSPACPLLPLHA